MLKDMGLLNAARRALAGTSPLALAGGVLGYAAGHLPSLLPRPWYWQGVSSGVSTLLGYQSGAGLDALWRAAHNRDARPPFLSPSALRVVALGLGALAVPVLARRYQTRIARYVHRPTPPAWWPVASTVAGAVDFAVLLAAWRSVGRLIRALDRHLDAGRTPAHWYLALVSRALASLVVLGTLGLIGRQVYRRGLIVVAGTISARVDRRTPAHLHQPTNPLRSGSPASLTTWASLGLQGKRFVCAGPNRARLAGVLAEVTGFQHPVREPIRAYASLNGRRLDEVVARVEAEMDRTDAWSRRALLVVTTTGRGNANEWCSSSFEYLVAGDCAIVALQYSGLPSAVTLAQASTSPADSTRALITTIEQRLVGREPGDRPKIYLAGESLGALGSTEAFADLDDLVARVDGAVWTGPPAFASRFSQWVDQRDPGSTTICPVVDRGRHLRFARRSADLDAPDGTPLAPWESPRLVCLQNDTDPVGYCAKEVIWCRPAWLDEAGGGSPMAQMVWVPLVSYLQLGIDMTVCRLIGAGYGHKYGAAQCVGAWSRVLHLDPGIDWSPVIRALNHDVPPIAG